MSRMSESSHARWEHDQEIYSEADIPRYQGCPTCGGRGLVSHPDAYEQDECEQCWGTGEIECPSPSVSRPSQNSEAK